MKRHYAISSVLALFVVISGLIGNAFLHLPEAAASSIDGAQIYASGSSWYDAGAAQAAPGAQVVPWQGGVASAASSTVPATNPAAAIPTVPAATAPATPPQSVSIAPASAGVALIQRKATLGDYNLLGKPSISVATIEQVLRQYNSPAIGDGQAFYDLGIKYGVDPAFMLAFYVHESAAGTAGAAVATRSVGNIICAGWSGACIGRFRAYDNYVQAAEDWYQLITGPLYIGAGLTTPKQITPRYAPSSDNNDPNGYAQTVERLVDQWRTWQ